MRIDVKYNQTPQRPLTIWEKLQIAELFCQYPALTLKVLFHRKVGLRRADPVHVFIMAGLLLFVASTNHNAPLALFAIAVAVAGYWQHFSRWRELRGKEGAPWHTYSDGISPLEDLMVKNSEDPDAAAAPKTPARAALTATAQFPSGEAPKQKHAQVIAEKVKKAGGLTWLVGESRIYRRIEPMTLTILGGILALLGTIFYAMSTSLGQWLMEKNGSLATIGEQTQSLATTWNLAPLGFWIMFAAACLGADENLKWRHQVKAYLDWYDGQIDGATARTWGGKKGRSKVRSTSRRQSYGLPTGIGSDVRQNVERQAEFLQQQLRKEEPAPSQPAQVVLDAPNNLNRPIRADVPEEAEALSEAQR